MDYKIYFVLLIVTFLFGCGQKDSCDNNYIPYNIKAFDVFVYNDNTDKEYYAGRINTNYVNALSALEDARQLAYDYAKKKYLNDWDYLCCTVTNTSDCVTKIR